MKIFKLYKFKSKKIFLVFFTLFHVVISMYFILLNTNIEFTTSEAGKSTGLPKYLINAIMVFLTSPIFHTIRQIESQWSKNLMNGPGAYIPLLLNSILWAFLAWYLYNQFVNSKDNI